MYDRRKINVITMLLVGLGMPIYFKTRYFLSGDLTLDQIFSVYLLADIFVPLSLSALMVYGYQYMEKRFLNRASGTNSMVILVLKMLLLVLLASGVAISYIWFFFTFIVPYPPGFRILLRFRTDEFAGTTLCEWCGHDFALLPAMEIGECTAKVFGRRNLKAQFEILKNQVNPHFLFNCFNALSVLIKESQPRADEFLRHLAKVYRFVLEVKEKELIKLREELEVMQSYVHLMKSRLGEKLMVQLNVPEKIQGYHIPPLTLQILMENALKHNKATADEPFAH